jgi:hypothetical protein
MAAYELLELYCELIVARLPIIDSQKYSSIFFPLKIIVGFIFFYKILAYHNPSSCIYQVVFVILDMSSCTCIS